MSKYSQISKFLVKFLQNEVHKTGLDSAVLGLSGGLDSAVVAVLAKMAFGDNLLCIKMPSQYSSQGSLDDADELVKKFNLRAITKPITPMLKAYESENADVELSNLRVGNFSSRLRMNILFDASAATNALVLGTSNKSELMLGYGTIYGDLASALNPIGDLYKSEVYELAEHLGVVSSIINKAPSADLFEGQSDEEDLGYTYAQLDAVLKSYVEDRSNKEELLNQGFENELVEMIIKKIYQNQFKRKMPIIAKLTSRTINHDFNYPRDITL
ncbi:MAG: NAD+ synthase [Campylobacterota bacterium]|nr:NAD+ synthase [Campylobacterota bacterium]